MNSTKKAQSIADKRVDNQSHRELMVRYMEGSGRGLLPAADQWSDSAGLALKGEFNGLF